MTVLLTFWCSFASGFFPPISWDHCNANHWRLGSEGDTTFNTCYRYTYFCLLKASDHDLLYRILKLPLWNFWIFDIRSVAIVEYFFVENMAIRQSLFFSDFAKISIISSMKITKCLENVWGEIGGEYSYYLCIPS